MMSKSNKKREKKKFHSPAGNRTPVSRVTGGDTHHYTTEEVVSKWRDFYGFVLIDKDCAILQYTLFFF